MKRFTTYVKERRLSSGKKQRPVLVNDDSGSIHFLNLPPELLLMIVNNLTRRGKVALSETCIYMNNMLNREILFKDINIKSKNMLLSFSKTIKKSERKLGNYVVNLTLYRPVPDTRVNATDRKLSYSYAVNDKEIESSYVEDLMELLKYLPSLEHIILDEITPRFNFPLNTILERKIDQIYSVNKHIRKDGELFKSIVAQNSLPRLTLISELGWAIPLRSNLLWTFGALETLTLKSMIIDTTSLSSTKHLYNAETNQFMKDDTSKEYKSSVTSLVIDSCSIEPQVYNYFETYFANVENLSLYNIRQIKDLEIIEYFPKLKKLDIDLRSKVFTHATTRQIEQLDMFFETLFANQQLKEIKLFPKRLCRWTRPEKAIQCTCNIQSLILNRDQKT